MNLVPTERKQSEDDLERAAALFEKALAEDASFSDAAYHLGQAHQLLLNYDQSVKSFERAIADRSHRCQRARRMRGRADRAR